MLVLKERGIWQFLLMAGTIIGNIGCQSNLRDGLETVGTTTSAEIWLTMPDKSALFEKGDERLPFDSRLNLNPTIEVDTAQTYQIIDGFGYTLTGGSALHINSMEDASRLALLRELFSTGGNSIGISYLRLSIGASDLDEKPFSYNDLPAGETDLEMKKFSLAPDKVHLIPVLKEILSINPDIKLMGSPWSPPAWMKTNGDTRGGSLKPQYYEVYAQYLVRYIQEMQQEGIRIDAITIQNEPLHPGNNPSLLMLAEEQGVFIKNHLGPAFQEAGLDTKIIIYDHNADRPDYPISILNDQEVRKFVDGSAFHLYGGTIDALTDVHNAHPDKNLYFTEQWIGAPGNFPHELKWHVENLIIGATRNWCRTVLEWNLAADPEQEPHTDRGGCDRCLGALTIERNTVIRNPAYYIIAHASKFARPGSVRVASNSPEGLPNVAFLAPDGKKVLVVLNTSSSSKSFNIGYQGNNAMATLAGGAVGTFVW